DRTSSSCGIPWEASSSSAGCMRSRSLSEPTRIPTTGRSTDDMALRCRERDVAAELDAGERDPLDGLVGPRAGSDEVVSERSHVQDPAAVRDELCPVPRGPGVEDERTGLLRVLDAVDRRAAVVAALRVLLRGQDDGHGSGAAHGDVALEPAGRG